MNRTGIVVEIAANWVEITLALLILAVFGVLFDQLVTRLGEKTQGDTSLLVVIGVAVTVMVFGFLTGLGNAVVLFALFSASGLPMIVGDKIRYARKQAAQKAYERQVQERVDQEVESWLDRAASATMRASE